MKKTPAVIAGVFLLFSTYLFIPSADAACGTLTGLYDPSTYTSGTTLVDQSGCNNNATIVANTPVKTFLPARYQLNQSGSGQYFFQNTLLTNPTVFSIGVWFKTTTTSAAKIIGFVQNSGSGETSYDRHIYIGRDGKLFYGIYNNTANTTVSTKAVNDGKWHFVLATQNGAVGSLYVDSATAVTLSATPQNYSGYWKVGGYKLTGWSDNSGALGDGDWVGDIGKVYIYSSTQINASSVSTLYNESKSSYLNPTASISSSSGITATYRAQSNLQFTSAVDGKVTFFQSGKRIARCIKLATSSGAAICPWTPTVKSRTTIYASFEPTDSNFPSMLTQPLVVQVVSRNGRR